MIRRLARAVFGCHCATEAYDSPCINLTFRHRVCQDCRGHA